MASRLPGSWTMAHGPPSWPARGPRPGRMAHPPAPNDHGPCPLPLPHMGHGPRSTCPACGMVGRPARRPAPGGKLPGPRPWQAAPCLARLSNVLCPMCPVWRVHRGAQGQAPGPTARPPAAATRRQASRFPSRPAPGIRKAACWTQPPSPLSLCSSSMFQGAGAALAAARMRLVTCENVPCAWHTPHACCYRGGGAMLQGALGKPTPPPGKRPPETVAFFCAQDMILIHGGSSASPVTDHR